jgi:hypothetical protein
MCKICTQIARVVFEARARDGLNRMAIDYVKPTIPATFDECTVGAWRAFLRETSCPQICNLVKLLQASARYKLQPSKFLKDSKISSRG